MKILTNCIGLQAVLPQGYYADHVSVAEWGRVVCRGEYDAVVYLWNDESGNFIIREVRRQKPTIPIIVLWSGFSPEAALVEETAMLLAGADYLLPLATDEESLLARFATCLRRTQQDVKKVVLADGQLVVDLLKPDVRFDGKSIALTKSQLALLCNLAEHCDTIRSRRELSHVLGIANGRPCPQLRLVDSTISRLRRAMVKVEPALGELFVTVRSGGYILRSSVCSAEAAE